MTTEIVLNPDQAGRPTMAATPTPADPIPAFTGQVPGDLRQAIGRAIDPAAPHPLPSYPPGLPPRPRPVPHRQRQPARRLGTARRHPPRA